ncbi:bone morphogenetic protein 7 [Octopus bimaculoides]|uniref:bone morphogenetic protein 7 n=1 Tax=Octopus bimaculoides TaxID=37653 RepID=UPI00071E5F48|nr:bone morphogenetic protein 7 [Octopus bimaculoides]|eukprot:XP_014779144.1 PREDICTED: bone morphogenetic protein 7-like [Octopus bimaculoides]
MTGDIFAYTSHLLCLVLLAYLLCHPPCVWTTRMDDTGFYTDNGLEQSVMVSRIPHRVKKEFQQEILTLMGLHHKPKPRAPGKETSAPRFMIDLYNKLHGSGASGSIEDDDEDEHPHFFSRTLENEMPKLNSSDFHNLLTVICKSPSPKSYPLGLHKIHFLRHERDRTFFFDFGEVSPQETVTGAELRLYKSKDRRGRHTTYRIEVFTIQQGVDEQDKILVPETNHLVSSDFEGWILMNVTNAADSWTIMPASNMGLYLRITDMSTGQELRPNHIGIVGHRGDPDKQAFLVCFFKMSRQLHVRRTRSARRQMDTRTAVSRRDDSQSTWRRTRRYVRPVCQRNTMYVDFEALGWQSWIIAPEGYSAFYCDGDCIFPLGLNMNATNHAIVQLLLHTVKSQTMPKPCCSPTKLSAISVLYFDDNSNVILKKYRSMKVKACGCH